MAKTFKELKEQVRNIDPEAGAYLDFRERKGFYNNALYLRAVFHWGSTPQGYEYWQDIEDLLPIESVGGDTM